MTPPTRRQVLAQAAAWALPLLGCGRTGPIRLGFVGALSDRASDVGEAGRNGVLLAVEQRNARSGLRGRTVELVIEDDGQDREKARIAIDALIAAQVHAVIGPFTSAMAEVMLPMADAAQMVMVSPTVTSMSFFGKDDFLFRINRTTRDNARDYAARMVARGMRRIAAAYDLRNRNFTESWLSEFRTAYSRAGGQLVHAEPFTSQADTRFEPIGRRLLESRPDGLLFIASAVDVARLSQQARKQKPGIALAAAEWAATESLLELGGQSIEGLLIQHNYNRDDERPRYRQFVQAFQQRFQGLPGYSAVSAYDAATVVMDALERQGDLPSLKAALLTRGPFEGLQQDIAFDANGDTRRQEYFTEVRQGRYVPIP